MFRPSAIQTFRESMSIDYEKWHDGIGYDLEALDRLDDQGRREAEGLLLPRATNDWRDLEALARLGTPIALAAVRNARSAESPEIRLYAHTYGPEPSPDEWDAAIAYALENAEPFAGLVLAMRCASQHPSPAVIAALWRKVESRTEISYHAAECLCTVGGVIEDEWDMSRRGLFLRLQAADSDDRQAAVEELASLLSETLARRAR